MFCINCGSQLPEGSKFCMNCGTAVQQPEQDKSTEKTIELPKIQPPKFTEITREAMKEKQAQIDSQAIRSSSITPDNAPTAAQAVRLQKDTPMLHAEPLPQTAQSHAPKAASSRRNIIILVTALVLLIAACAAAVFAIGAVRERQADELLTTAERYLSNAEYEQAIIEFEKILAIDPYNTDAYLGIADALTALGRTDEAHDILSEAAKKIKDAQDLKKIDQAIEAINTVSIETTEPTAEATVTAEAPTVTTSASATSIATEEITPIETTDTAETADTAETTEQTAEAAVSEETEITYNDPEALAAEQMLMDYFTGNGELDTSLLSEITEFSYYYEKYVCVVMGNKGGTYLDVKDVQYSIFEATNYTLVMNDGTTDSYMQQFDYSNGEVPRLYGKFTDISFVEHMPKLRKFVSCGSSLNDLSVLCSLKQLEEIELYLNIGEYDISVYNEISTLKKLTLSRATMGYMSDGFRCTQLESLRLGRTDAPVESYADFTGLKELECSINDLSALAGLDKLERLSIVPEYADPTDEPYISAEPLLQLPALKELSFRYYSHIDELDVLAQLPQLSVLMLNFCGLTDLTALEAFSELDTLDISYNYDLSDNAVAELQEKLPDCEIIYQT